MAIQTAAMRNALVDAYKGQATYAALYSTAPGASAGTELTGGSYARKAVSWGATTNSASTATAIVFDVPSGATVAGFGFHTAVTAGTYLDGGSLTSQSFASAGTYTLTPTVTIA